MSVFPETNRIMIAESDPRRGTVAERQLAALGYATAGVATSGPEALEFCRRYRPELALIDVDLGGRYLGIETGSQLWRGHRLPLIFLAAPESGSMPKAALDAEPYSYLFRPLEPELLAASVATALHKHRYFFPPEEREAPPSSYLPLGKRLRFHLESALLYKGNQPLPLTVNERKFLELLARHPGRTVPFREIVLYVWRRPIDGPGPLRNLVYRFRNKLDEEVVECLYRTGYRLKIG